MKSLALTELVISFGGIIPKRLESVMYNNYEFHYNDLVAELQRLHILYDKKCLGSVDRITFREWLETIQEEKEKRIYALVNDLGKIRLAGRDSDLRGLAESIIELGYVKENKDV